MKVLSPVPFWAVLAPEGRSAKAVKQPSNRERVITSDPGSWLVPRAPFVLDAVVTDRLGPDVVQRDHGVGARGVRVEGVLDIGDAGVRDGQVVAGGVGEGLPEALTVGPRGAAVLAVVPLVTGGGAGDVAVDGATEDAAARPRLGPDRVGDAGAVPDGLAEVPGAVGVALVDAGALCSGAGQAGGGTGSAALVDCWARTRTPARTTVASAAVGRVVRSADTGGCPFGGCGILRPADVLARAESPAWLRPVRRLGHQPEVLVAGGDVLLLDDPEPTRVELHRHDVRFEPAPLQGAHDVVVTVRRA